MPIRWLSVYSPVNARSVPALRSTSYSSALSSARHSSSDFSTFGGGISSVRFMRSTVPTRGAPPITNRGRSPDLGDAEDPVDDRQRRPDEDEPDDDLGGRAPRSAQPSQAGAEGGEVLQLAVGGVRVGRAAPGPVDVGRADVRLLAVVVALLRPHRDRVGRAEVAASTGGRATVRAWRRASRSRWVHTSCGSA